MKVIIAGSRDITDYKLVWDAVAEAPFTMTEIVSGAARGVDQLAIRYAKEHGIRCKEFPVSKKEWDTIGKGAGHVRNRKMAEYADALIAIWDGSSPGTKGMIDIATQRFGSSFVYVKRI